MLGLGDHQPRENLSIQAAQRRRGEHAFGRAAGAHHGVNAGAENRGGNAGGKIAVADQPDARAGGANIVDELARGAADRARSPPGLPCRDSGACAIGANIVDDRRVEIHGALAAGPDDNFFHVQIGRVEQSALFAGGQHGDGVRAAPVAQRFVPSSGSTAISTAGICANVVVNCAAPTFSPMKSMGASSRSPSPMTMVPSMGDVYPSCVRMAFTAASSDLMAVAEAHGAGGGNGRLLDDAQHFQTQ